MVVGSRGVAEWRRWAWQGMDDVVGKLVVSVV